MKHLTRKRLFKILRRTKDSTTELDQLLVESSALLESDEATKLIHDLNGAVRAVRLSLQSQHLSIINPTERDIRKAQQLADHAAKLEWAVAEVCHLLDGREEA